MVAVAVAVAVWVGVGVLVAVAVGVGAVQVRGSNVVSTMTDGSVDCQARMMYGLASIKGM